MFKFNFQLGSEENDDQIDTANEIQRNKDKEENLLCESLSWYKSQEIIPNEDHLKNMDIYKLNSTCVNLKNYEIFHVDSTKFLKNLTNEKNTNDIRKAESNHSDLIPGVYEGGAKIWECTDDLLSYLTSSGVTNNLQDKMVLDLGCGAGLLGIFSFKCGATVHFQDYNQDVLESITIPNFLLNLTNLKLEDHKHIKFYSGDWSNYADLTKNDERFDLILTSETIYNPTNQTKILDTFDAKLKPDGLILLAAKTYYFGVGGGLRQFEKLLESDNRFISKVVWISNLGICREILEIKFRKAIL